MNIRRTLLVQTLLLTALAVATVGCGDSGGTGSNDSSDTGLADDTAADDDAADDDAADDDAADDDAEDDTASDDDAGPGGDDDASMGGDDTTMSGDDAVMGDHDTSMGGDDTAMGGDDTSMGGDDASMGLDDAWMGGDAEMADDAELTVDEFFASFCEESCAEYVATCGDLSAIGGDGDGCVALCEQRLTETTDWITNYSCLEDGCNLGGCFPDDQPLPLFDGCEPACAELDACDLAWIIDLPEDEPELCNMVCSGAVANQEGVAEALECLVETLDESCDPEGFEACFGQGPGQGDLGCAAMCDSFLDPASDSDFVCAADDPIHAIWASADECVAACEEVPEESQATLYGCWIANACENPAACDELPAANFEACDLGCEAIQELCGPDVDMPPGELCGSLCTGILAGFGLEAGNPDAAACLEELDSCPEEDAFGAVFQCAMPPVEVSEACEELCGTISECFGEEDPGCPGGCSQLEIQQPVAFAAIQECIAAANGDCASIGACLPNDDAEDAPELCVDTCVNIGLCSGEQDPPSDQCLGQCGQAVEEDLNNVTIGACQANTACQDIEACSALGSQIPFVECAAACEGVTTCDEWAEGTCELACTGALIGLDSAGMGLADCVVEAFGTSCGVDASSCAP